MLFWLFWSSLQVKLREMKPGQLSQELKEALGMPDGAPPPWLINMQVSTIVYCVVLTISLPIYFPKLIFFCAVYVKTLPRYCRLSTVTIGYLILCLWKKTMLQRYGPPPSYPHLKIPGLNAPIPEGASFGYHAGGWGKPPVDEVRNISKDFACS